MVTGFSVSNTMMSASDPTAMVPFCGYMPMSLAGLVALTSTKRSSESRPVRTPSE